MICQFIFLILSTLIALFVDFFQLDHFLQIINLKNKKQTLSNNMNYTSISTVAFVILLIIFLAISYCSFYLPALYRQNLLEFWMIMPTCIVTVLIGCFSYFKAVWVAPGYPDFSQKSHYSREQIDNMKRRSEQQKQFKKLSKDKKDSSQIKKQEIANLAENSYCQKCDNIKLSRTHHCRICKRCITRMDHHCPWVGNCVGKYNHKYFYLFLLYVTIALAIVSTTIIVDFINMQQPVLTRIYQLNQIYYIITLLTGGMCVLLLFAIGFLLVGQSLLVYQNLTTLESFYDGIYQNNPFTKQTISDRIKQITGQSLWFLPTKPFPGHIDQINVAFNEQ